jgi:GR25 family glycosyltransferase involved in LPS biosynthesis
MFHKLVDKVYAINLKTSEDRRNNIYSQCHKIGTHFELVEAIDGREENVHWVRNEWNSKYDGWTQGAAGLVHTTINIIKDAKKNNYKSIMIMEDDIVFKHNAYKDAKKLFETLPEDWELFHLASQNYSNKILKRFGDLVQLKSSWSCQIYMINENVYDEYLEWLELVDRPIDSITSCVIHPRGKSYAPISDLIVTIPNYSTIRDMEINYGIVN